MRPATSGCPRCRLFAVAAGSDFKGARHWMHRSGCRGLRFQGEPERRFSADETAALSHTLLKEKRLVKRALYDLTVNRLVSRQRGIIEISIRLSTACGKKFHTRDKPRKFAVFERNLPYRGLLILGNSLKASTFNKPRSFM